MRALLLAALLLATPALAQDVGEKGWVVEDAASDRFPDADIPGPELKQGDEVVVLFRDGERVRVRRGAAYGWVPTSVLSPFPQSAPSEAPALPPQGDFDPGALEALLERTKSQETP